MWRTKKHKWSKNVTSRYSYKQEVLSLQSLYCRRIHPGSVTKELLQWSLSAVVELPHLNIISTKKLTMTTNYINGTKCLWYEQSMVRIVYGPNSQWYEKSRHRLLRAVRWAAWQRLREFVPAERNNNFLNGRSHSVVAACTRKLRNLCLLSQRPPFYSLNTYANFHCTRLRPRNEKMTRGEVALQTGPG